jgi:DNA-binding NtrC family response regulator
VSERPLSTQMIDGAVPRLELEDAELRVDAGPDKGARHPIGYHSLVIGSAPDCQLVLHDGTVSARHAEISLGRAGHVIRDLGAKNGTRLGNVRIERAPLFVGAKLQLGATRLSVHARGGTSSIELAQPGVLGDLVAHSVAMRAVVASLERLAATDATLLVEGETGTGKEVVARLTHALGPRRHAPLVVFDCGAVSPHLIAAELFGVERGAFTDAVETRAGLFERAEGGTLFLDEIGELPLELQPALLRALEARRTRRIGGAEELSHDVRIIAATNRNLAEEVRAGRFRADLYYRLAVTSLRLPPLRERREDIPVLAQRFAVQLGLELSPELLTALAAHDWPGNIRELRNAIERAQIQHGPDALLLLGARRAPRGPLVPLAEARRTAAERFEREYLVEALEAAGGNLSRAAELAGVSRQLLTQLARKHGMRARDRRE